MAFEIVITLGGLAVVLAFLFYKTESALRPVFLILSLLSVFVLLFTLTILRADFNNTKTMYNSGGGVTGYEVSNASATLDGGTTGVVVTFFQAFSWVFWLVIALVFLAFLFNRLLDWQEGKRKHEANIFEFNGGKY